MPVAVAGIGPRSGNSTAPSQPVGGVHAVASAAARDSPKAITTIAAAVALLIAVLRFDAD
jgi:hypothetical protein